MCLSAAEEEKGLVCQCEGCLTKKARLESEKPKRWVATTLRQVPVATLLVQVVALYFIPQICGASGAVVTAAYDDL